MSRTGSPISRDISGPATATAPSPHDPLPGAPDFTWHELVRSAVAEKLGLDNTPSCEAEARLIHIAQEIAQPARYALGPISITSGYRSPELNAKLHGASPRSAHIAGAALDMRPRMTCTAALALFIFDNLEFDQIILERARGGFEWVHAALWPDLPNRRQLRRHFLRDKDYPYISRATLEAWAMSRI